MTTEKISPAAQAVVDKVKALREYTQRTGFKTTRSQNDLIQAIRNPEDLAAVIMTLKK
ncbi:MAG TPA: hypothetical protein VJP02_17840 [Candidatus Sulfotelmatobacter sp.]|nr:hypothetical protein [Candidatus Sulfotelmatobacter sp.]